MLMLTLNATDVRNNFGQFIDTVVREHPQVIKRSRDHLLAISMEHLHFLLKDITFHAKQLQEADGSITLSLDELDLVTNGETLDHATLLMAEEMKEYAQEYEKEFKLYFQSPNRKAHFPFVLKILVQEDLQGIASLIDA